MIVRCAIALYLVVGLLAPVLATDRPVLLRLDGAWSSPAIAGDRRAPDGSEWQAFWLDPERDRDGSIVIMAPCPHDPQAVDVEAAVGRAGSSLDATPGHWLGVDAKGRDHLARLIHATRTTIAIGVVATGLAFVIGVVLGALAGLGPRPLRAVTDRLILVTMAFPVLIGVLAVSSVVRGGFLTTAWMLAVFFWTPIARNVRSELLRQRSLERIETARSLRFSWLRILFRHGGDEIFGPLRVLTVAVCIDVILVEAALSFLGFGEESISYGGLLRDGRFAALAGGGLEHWLPPALAMSVLVLLLHRVVAADGADRRRLPVAAEPQAPGLMLDAGPDRLSIGDRSQEPGS